jgi:putative Mg2+ transporter-C (MgtC) family protein
MSLETQFVAVMQILLAAVLSMLIGLERERRRHAAGLRTHMLVGLGACLFTTLSISAFPGDTPARVAANVITGVGFLGAGTIIQRKNAAHDLTTAASIWATSAVGMAAGAGAWFLAISVTLIIWTVLAVLRRFEGPKKPISRPRPTPSVPPPRPKRPSEKAYLTPPSPPRKRRGEVRKPDPAV